MAATIYTLRDLGYTVAHASGGVEVEEEALAAARAQADPATIAEQAAEVTRMTISDLNAAGRLPDETTDRRTLAEQIADAAIEGITARVTDKVAFHERALEIARSMPTTYRVDGHGASTYVNVNDSDGSGSDADQQALLDSLADEQGIAERDYALSNAETMSAAEQFRSAGYAVTRPTPGADTFEVDGETLTGDELVARVAAGVTPKPDRATARAEAIATVLATAPEIGEDTRRKLIDALKP